MRKLKILIVISICLLFSSKSFSNDNIGEIRSQKNYLNSTDTVIDNYTNEQINTKGQFRFHFSFPYINSFYLTPLNENTKNNTGFMGASYGLDYFYNTNKYINFSFSQIGDFYSPLPFRNYWKVFEVMDSYYFSLSNNHKIKRFSLGYGFSLAKNSWELINNGWDKNSSTREPVKKTNYALGLIFSSYFQLTPAFYLGIIYKPTFLRPDIAPTYTYEHSISIDIGWKIPLNKKITAANTQ